MASQESHPCPYLHSNKWSKTFHSWISKLIDRSHQQGTLSLNDLYDPLPQHEAKQWINKLENHWLKEFKNSGANASLLRATIQTMGWQPLLIGLFLIPEKMMILLQPIFIIYLMDYFELCSTMSIFLVLVLTLLNCVTNLLQAYGHHEYFYRITLLGLKMRVAYQGLVYQKLLRLSSRALTSLGTGETTNLFSNDASQIKDALRFLNHVWASAITIFLTVLLFWYYIKHVALVSIGFALIVVLIAVLTGHFLVFFRTRVLIMTDQRVKTMSEIIQSMRIVKMYCWEAAFNRKIRLLRKKEIIRHLHRVILESIQIIISYAYVCVVLLITYSILWSKNMRFDTRFFAVASCMLYQLEIAIIELTYAIKYLVNYITAERRLQKFLSQDETERDQRLSSSSENHRLPHVHCNLIHAYWHDIDSFALKNIMFDAQPGDLICIIGPVGSGKSSLLQTLSGEIFHCHGDLRLNGSFCYVPQEPWIFSSSIKKNILFDADYNAELFFNVLRVTALDVDVAQFPDGINTLVGDHGVMLSGGQKARVNMARALYRNADIYLLDDPLSAVDTKVSKHLFDKSIKEYLQKKISILVTHQIQFLQEATRIIVLDRGNVVQSGSYSDLLANSSTFNELLKDIDQHERVDDSQRKQSIQNDPVSDYGEENDQLIPSEHAEGQEKGSVNIQVYLDYIRAGVGRLRWSILVLIVFIVYQICVMSYSWWLAKWSENEGHRYASLNNCSQTVASHIEKIRSMSENDWIRQQNRSYYIFSGFSFALIFLIMIRTSIINMICLNASRVLHNKMFQRLIRCPISFFDNNPAGRIINRFTKDLSSIDEELPETLFELVDCLFQVLGIVALVSFINPWSFIPVVVAASAMFYIRYRFAPCSRDLKRLVGVSRSPYYSHFTSTIHGLKVIRSHRAEQSCQKEFCSYIDVNNTAEYLLETTNRWAAIRFDWSVTFFVMAVTLIAVIVRSFGQQISSGDIALTLSYSTSLMGLIQWMIRQSVALEVMMTAVERVLEYSRLEQEPPAQLPPPNQPPTNWPSNGCIEYEHVIMSHSNNPNALIALNDISLRIESCEKIGVVGRTGAGKSSFIQTLFRFGTLLHGRILIDGIDISTIGLNDLRRRLSIIPQDPVLFVGTMRSNLDQFGDYSDAEIWHALEQVQLKGFVTDVLRNGLQSLITERGSNLSIGQKQLVCLARAILKKSKILVIDEATANVDNETDELIQRAIREKFRECTVITVAHRLRTVIDSDRIMVLDHGELVEFNSPAVLLNNQESYFSMLVNQTGSSESEYLRHQAAKSILCCDMTI